jgi:hypothetical protein
MKAKLLITIYDHDGEVLAPKGTVFEWIVGEDYHRVNGHLMIVKRTEIQEIEDDG